MKVLLIYSPITCYGKGIIVKSHVPMGLLSLATYIKKLGYEIKVLDALAEGWSNIIKKGNTTKIGLSWTDIKNYINEYKPDVIGISVMFTSYYNDAVDLAKKIKKYDPKIKVVFGGVHVSIDPVGCLKFCKSVDYIIYGEGEISFKELLEAIEKGEGLHKIKGLVYRQKSKIMVTAPRELIKNINDLPFPDWSLIDIKKYDVGELFQMRTPCFIVETSRGCPNHCIYCSSYIVWKHHWRARSAVNVVDEIEMLVKKYGAKEISFYDDSMSVDKNRMKEICREIIYRKLDIKWSTPNGIAHWTLDKPLIKLMKRAGCYRITFGIESGDPKMRRWIGKPYSLKQAKVITKYANRIGLWTVATNIIGFPYETKKQIDRTLRFSIESEVDLAFFYRLGLRPGALIYEIFKNEGLLPKNQNLLFGENLSSDTHYFSGEELIEIQRQMYATFMKKRWGSTISSIYRLIFKIKNIEDLMYVTKQAQLISSFCKGDWALKQSSILT